MPQDKKDPWVRCAINFTRFLKTKITTARIFKTSSKHFVGTAQTTENQFFTTNGIHIAFFAPLTWLAHAPLQSLRRLRAPKSYWRDRPAFPDIASAQTLAYACPPSSVPRTVTAEKIGDVKGEKLNYLKNKIIQYYGLRPNFRQMRQ